MSLDGRVQAVEPLAVRIPQAAHMLGIGKSKLYEFIATGEIETIRPLADDVRGEVSEERIYEGWVVRRVMDVRAR